MKLDKIKLSECKYSFFAIQKIQEVKNVKYFEDGTLCSAIEALQELERISDF